MGRWAWLEVNKLVEDDGESCLSSSLADHDLFKGFGLPPKDTLEWRYVCARALLGNWSQEVRWRSMAVRQEREENL